MNKVEIFTDGACKGNPGPGGWGAILRYGTTEKEIYGASKNTTNNINNNHNSINSNNISNSNNSQYNNSKLHHNNNLNNNKNKLKTLIFLCLLYKNRH